MINEIILGIVQGITEWLPISSQGQIVFLALNFLGMQADGIMEDILLLHLGTTFAALVYFQREILKIFNERKKINFYFFALIGTCISAIPSYLFLDYFLGSVFALNLIVGVGLIGTGFVLRMSRKGKEDFSIKNGFVLGLVQGLAVIPGLSRSGLSSGYLLFRGFKAEEAFKTSFILAVPSILGANILMGLKKGVVLNFDIFIGILFAFLVGYLLIDVVLRLARKWNFSKVCYGLGLLYLIVTFFEFVYILS